MRPAWARSDLGSDPVRHVVLPALVALPMAAALAFGGVHYLVAFALVAGGAGLFVANPRTFILVFLGLISLRNLFAGGERIGGDRFNVDLGGIANVLVSGMGVVYFLVLWKNPFKGRSLTLPYGLFLGLFAASMYWAPDLRWAIRFVTRLAAPFFTYLIISDMIDRKMVRDVIRAIYWSSAIPIAYGFFQLFTGDGNRITQGYVRVNSTFWHPAHFSMYLTFLFCVAYSEFLDSAARNRALRVAYIACLVVLEIATYTRISWLAFAVCFVYLSWAYGRRTNIVVGALAAGFIALAWGEGIIDRVASSAQAMTTVGIDTVYDLNTSVGWRLYFWDEILRRFVDRPWFGFGAGSSVLLGEELFGIEASPHNGYLRVLYETGVVGFVLFVAVFATMFRQGMRLLRQDLALRLTYVNHVYITMTVTYVLLNLTDNILEYYEVAVYQWAILSLVEYNNLRAARAGLIAATDAEDGLETDEEALAEVRALARPVEPPPVAPPANR